MGPYRKPCTGWRDGRPSPPCGECRSCSPDTEELATVVSAGGWFVACDGNGDPMVVALPARPDRGS